MAIGKVSGVDFNNVGSVSSSTSQYAYSISGSSQDFEMTISISDAATAFLLPVSIINDDGIDGVVFWGDSTTSPLVFGTVASHTYSSVGTYNVRVVCSSAIELAKVYGSVFDNPPTSIDAWGSSFNSFQSQTDLGNVTTLRKYPPVNYISGWGNSTFRDWRSLNTDLTEYTAARVPAAEGDYTLLFYNNLLNTGIGMQNFIDSSATSIYAIVGINVVFNADVSGWDVSNVNDFAYAFTGCTAFNQDIGNWDVRNGLNFREMLQGATSFDQDINNWDVSNAENLREIFRGCTSFNQDISGWNVSNASDRVGGIWGMFEGATSFDQDISNWERSTPGDVATLANVQAMSQMFEGATSFNQDINNWDTSSCRGFVAMFYDATSFDQDLSNWDFSSATQVYDFYNNNASIANKAKTLVGIVGNVPNTGCNASDFLGSAIVFDKSATVGVEGYNGQDTYGAWLKVTGPTPATNKASGTTTSFASNRLIDSSASFTATVVEGCVVENTTSGTFAEVNTIVSDTELILSDDIFGTASNLGYTIDGGYGWSYSGTSFV